MMRMADFRLRIADLRTTGQNCGASAVPSGPKSKIPNPKSGGFSIIELLIALSISSVLLIAVVSAIDASFYAYASAAESASTQSTSRMVVMRLTSLIRTTTLHDAYDPDDPSVMLGHPSQPPVQTVGIQMVDSDGRLLKIWWAVNAAYGEADLGDLWYQQDANAAQPLLEQVRAQRTNPGDQPYIFTLSSRADDAGLLLTRATLDLTVQPGADATLALEAYQGAAEPVRLMGSAVPRKTSKY